jgi:6-phosphogluconolactonase (cycloisomerase 2 family)
MKSASVRVLCLGLFLFLWFASFTTNVHAEDQFLYTNDDRNGPSTVSAFRVGADGSLTKLSGSPFTTGGKGCGGGFFASNRIVVSARGNFLYASNAGSNDVSAFSIAPSSGTLTPVPGSPFLLDSPGSGCISSTFVMGISLATTPDGRFLMAGNPSSETITSFRIGTDGSLTAISSSPFFAGGTPIGMKVSPNGKFLAAGLFGSVAIFGIAPDGSLTSVPGSPFPDGGVGFAAGVDVNCKSNLLFAGEANNGNTIVDVFSIGSNGALTPITGSPFLAGVGNNSNIPLLSPDDRLLFVSNQNSPTVTAFRVAPDGTLTLVPGSPFAVGGGNSARGMATNPSGTLLFTANDIDLVGVLTVASDGTLTPAQGSPISTGSLFSYLTSLAAFPSKSCGITVDIDIKPGSSPAPINPKSHGKIPVAILSSPTFNATAQIEQRSLTFGRTGDEPSLVVCDAVSEHVNGDGLPDLVCHFDTQTAAFQKGDTQGTLKGKTKTGIPLFGVDSIRIVPGK